MLRKTLCRYCHEKPIFHSNCYFISKTRARCAGSLAIKRGRINGKFVKLTTRALITIPRDYHTKHRTEE